MTFKFTRWLIMYYISVIATSFLLKDKLIQIAIDDLANGIVLALLVLLFGLSFGVVSDDKEAYCDAPENDGDWAMAEEYIPPDVEFISDPPTTPESNRKQRELCNAGIDLPPKGNRGNITNKYWKPNNDSTP